MKDKHNPEFFNHAVTLNRALFPAEVLEIVADSLRHYTTQESKLLPGSRLAESYLMQADQIEGFAAYLRENFYTLENMDAPEPSLPTLPNKDTRI